jgi:hypothetical protein
MRKKKIIVGIVLMLLLVGIVSAGIMSYFARVRPTFNVKQSVTINGKNYNEPIDFTEEVIAGNTVKKKYLLQVNCNNPVNISVKETIITGISITYHLDGVPIVFPLLELEKGNYTLIITWEFSAKLTSGTYKPSITFSLS